MREIWFDRIAVAGTVLFALAWLVFYFRRLRRAKNDAKGGVGACGSPCEGCPYGDNCGGKTR